MENEKIIYRESQKDIPTMGKYDVIVAGGGPAGCSAAISAARHGADVLLVEKDGYSGGAAVSQLVCVILSTNGADFQGIWHEFMNNLENIGGVYEKELSQTTGSENTRPMIRGSVDPELVKYTWEKMMTEAGVDIFYHTYVIDTMIENKVIKGVILETKAGKRAVYGKRIIDCTGDGIVASKAGVPWEQGDEKGNKYAMACTKVFRLGNVHKPDNFPTEEHIQEMEKGLEKAIKNKEYTTPVITTGRVLNYAKGWLWPLPEHRTELMLVTSRVLKVDPLDPFDMTRAEIEGRDQAIQVADFYRKYVPGCENSYLLDTSNHLGVRSSRRIEGIEKVTAEDVLDFKKYEDGIARGSWDVDVWPADSYTKSAMHPCGESVERKDKMRNGDYYDIRYGAIVAQDIDNLMMAGRCISAEHLAEASLRIQQTCMATGQAAGTAAALSIVEGKTPREMNYVKIVNQLKEVRAKVKPAFELLMDK